MKKIILLGLLLLSQYGYGQFRAKVDERFELTSIAFSLAGVPEYCQCQIPSYSQDIDADMTHFEMTEPIHYIRELNQKHGIGYDAVSTTASMLEIVDGRIRLQAKYDASKISDYDSRWNESLFLKYIEMLNKFYKQSNFHKFFKDHADLYLLAEQRMDAFLKADMGDWFESFYGTWNQEDAIIYISLVNGSNNYSVPNGILIGMHADEEGEPTADISGMQFLVIHEIAHHYTNPLFENHWDEIENAANKMYPYVKEKMVANAYGSAYATFGEWLNNLFTLMYLKDKASDSEDLDFLQYGLTEMGFIWMPRSVKFMEHFYAHRDQYPLIEDFMPQLIGFLSYTAEHYDLVIQEYETRKPLVTCVYPAVGSNLAGVKEIVVSFSKPMHNSYGFCGTGSEDESILQLPFDYDSVHWSEDRRSIIIPILTNEIRENCIYGVQLFPRAFASTENFSLDDRCKNLWFKVE